MNRFEKIILHEEYRFIERGEHEVNGAWKGAHLLLFFLAFVFGSFCTFCFHMLMYLFNEKCVLFPKLLSLKTIRHNIIYDMVTNQKNGDVLPVDFLSTQWVDKSECYLPTYVPLVSGIFGLVWTTMFLMCSTGSRTMTGLQKPWRVLAPIFIFSLAMGALCIYSSTITHKGLMELCVKLGEISGSSGCTYTINVVTLAYERRIRGVYQATQLTILSAWLHTSCWLLSAALAVVRVLLAVDFQLVRITAELQGDIDKMLERHEKQLRNVFPDEMYGKKRAYSDEYYDYTDVIAYPPLKENTARIDFQTEDGDSEEYLHELKRDSSQFLFFELKREVNSDLSLLPEERFKIARNLAFQKVPRDKRFIVELVFDFIYSLELPKSKVKLMPASEENIAHLVAKARDNVISHGVKPSTSVQTATPELQGRRKQKTTQLKDRLIEDLAKDTSSDLNKTIAEMPEVHRPRSSSLTNKQINIESGVINLHEDDDSSPKPSTSKKATKSNLKNTGVQTDRKVQKVKISTPSSETVADEVDKETQTNKEKQD